MEHVSVPLSDFLTRALQEAEKAPHREKDQCAFLLAKFPVEEVRFNLDPYPTLKALVAECRRDFALASSWRVAVLNALMACSDWREREGVVGQVADMLVRTYA